MAWLTAGFALILAAIGGNAFGQTLDTRPAPVVEFLAGYAGFVMHSATSDLDGNCTRA
jgi:hypothetical protein